MILLTLLTILIMIPVQITDTPEMICPANTCYVRPETTNAQTDGVGSQDEPVGYVQKAEQFVEFGIIPSEIVEGFAEYDEEVIEWIASVAFCESRFNRLADNPVSDATGYFQYMPATFVRYSKGDILALEGQFDAMRTMLDYYGSYEVLKNGHWWEETKWCVDNI